MNFDDAIKAHAAWKMKLTAYLQKPDQSLNPTQVHSDHTCALGQWIYGEGAKFQHLKEFATLKLEHGKFHRAAAEVVRKANSGQAISEDVALGSHSDFANASVNVVTALMTMKRLVK